jgi:hypothetical protein
MPWRDTRQGIFRFGSKAQIRNPNVEIQNNDQMLKKGEIPKQSPDLIISHPHLETMREEGNSENSPF